MSRLYFRIYLAVLGSIALFALLAGLTWRLFGTFEHLVPPPEFFQTAAERLVPAAGQSAEQQRRELSDWSALSGYELGLFGPDGKLIAESADRPLPSPLADYDRPRGRQWRGPFGIYALKLADGRWLVVARPRGERGPLARFGWIAALMGMAVAVAVAAYPLVRRVTRRLEVLQDSVEAFGAGDLGARAVIKGNDEIARLAAKFNHSAARIENLVRANKTLLANASHELRSPLARLTMASEGLAATAPAATRIEINRNIAELDQLIEEILLASRLDARGSERPSEIIDAVAVAAEECARGGAELEAPAGGSIQMTGDARLLRRLMRNLIENGKRYGSGETVELAFRRPTQPMPQVVFEVLDRGPGVPESERERIFEPFYRPAGTRERDGSVGLGLSLVRQIARLHGGQVICLAREGGGTCMRVTLPLNLPV